jgi:hypothetical protein
MDTQARRILVWSLVGQPGQQINGSPPRECPRNDPITTCQDPKQTAKYMHIKGLKKKKGYSLE